MTGLVWYAAYGSNLLRARFLCYLEGGAPAPGMPVQRGAADPAPPRDERAVTLPFERYFGQHAEAWGGAVAFLDPLTRGDTPGRAYLLTEEQFSDVLAQENGWPDRAPRDQGWYRCVLGLGEIEGVPLRTITSLDRHPAGPPSVAYLDVVRRGEAETAMLDR